MRSSKHRDWGETAALLIGLVLFVSAPHRYTLAGPWLTWTLASIMVVTCALSVIWTLAGSRQGRRASMVIAAGVLALALVTSMVKMVYLVIYHAGEVEGSRLLETALVIWVSNVIVFAVIYHLLGEADFAFPGRAENAVEPVPFLDYVFLAFTTATAFSPTDTAPLTTRARMLMMVESTVSLATLAITAARAVNILS